MKKSPFYKNSEKNAKFLKNLWSIFMKQSVEELLEKSAWKIIHCNGIVSEIIPEKKIKEYFGKVFPWIKFPKIYRINFRRNIQASRCWEVKECVLTFFQIKNVSSWWNSRKKTNLEEMRIVYLFPEFFHLTLAWDRWKNIFFIIFIYYLNWEICYYWYI